MKLHMCFRFPTLVSNLAYSKNQIYIVYISTVNISKMLTDTVNTIVAVEYDVAMGLQVVYLDLILIYFKGQGHAHFDCEYL